MRKRQPKRSPVLPQQITPEKQEFVMLKLSNKSNVRDEVAMRLSDTWTALTDDDILKIAEVVGL